VAFSREGNCFFEYRHYKSLKKLKFDPIPESIVRFDNTLSYKLIQLTNARSLDLSHVPCKFFRQGACQAGNSCPFSHATDSSSSLQPCKYFLKGNCKFGVKCALAHVLPDGKRLNTSSTSHLTLRSNKQPLRTNSGSHSSPSNVSSEPINIANEPQYQAATTYTQSSPTFSYGNSIWSNSLNVPSISNTSTSNVGYNPLFNSPSELMYSPTSSSNMILPSSNYQNTTNSLIDSEFDDDTEDIDFIPNSLVDLLTPQELHRRKSRASFGSQAQFIGMPSLKELTLAEEETTFIMD
ncbi:Zinc finger protein LEE1, partial [Pichia kudriavzevii]